MSKTSIRYRRTIFRSLYYFGASVVAIIAIFPIFWIFVSSFKTEVQAFSTTPTLFSFPLYFGNYVTVIDTLDYVKYLDNSLIVAGFTVFFTVLIGSVAAYAFARLKFPGNRLIPTGMLIVRTIPSIAIILPVFLFFRGIHLLDTYYALVLVYTAFNMPYIVWILTSYFETIPRDIEEAAWMDGASKIQAFWRTFLPLAIPGLASAAIFSFLLSWNEFIFALLLTQVNAVTLPVMIAGLQSSDIIQWGPAMAAGTLTLIPPVLITTFGQKYLGFSVLSTTNSKTQG